MADNAITARAAASGGTPAMRNGAINNESIGPQCPEMAGPGWPWAQREAIRK